MKRTVKIVVFPEKERAAVIEQEADLTVTGDQVFVRTLYSGISAGTELANYHALPNTGTTGYKGMDEGSELIFPFYPGYSAVGVVEELGPEVKKLKVGDRVVVRWRGHRSCTVCKESDVVRIPDAVDSQEAAFTHISSFPFLGVRKLELQLGESCMVAGLGILGLFAVQAAHLSGAYPVLACDLSPERRAIALKIGADYAFDPADPDFYKKIKDVTDGRGPDGVVEVTGQIAALQQALEYVAWEGRITLLGCTRVSDHCIDFYKYVHKRGISLIGCHTATRPKFESRPGRWTEMDDYRTFLKLLAAKRIQVRPFINRIVKPEDADAIYHEIGFSKNPPFGVLFDWN